MKIHETVTATGNLSEVHLTFDAGSLAIASGTESLPVPDDALEVVMTRYGGPLEPTEPLIEVAVLDLGHDRRIRHVRHRALYDVIARDFLVYESPGRDAQCALATTVSAALTHLARANAAAGVRPSPRE